MSEQVTPYPVGQKVEIIRSLPEQESEVGKVLKAHAASTIMATRKSGEKICCQMFKDNEFTAYYPIAWTRPLEDPDKEAEIESVEEVI